MEEENIKEICEKKYQKVKNILNKKEDYFNDKEFQILMELQENMKNE